MRWKTRALPAKETGMSGNLQGIPTLLLHRVWTFGEKL